MTASTERAILAGGCFWGHERPPLSSAHTLSRSAVLVFVAPSVQHLQIESAARCKMSRENARVGRFQKAGKGFAVFGILSLAGLGLMQLARIDRQNPRVDQNETIEARAHMPAQIAGILHRACRDCHTEQTVWPWYSHFAPMLWLMVADVNAGREHMNLSRWGRYRLGEQVARLDGICEMVQKGKMPLWYYRPLHPSASLSSQDVSQLCAWAKSQSALLVGGAGAK